MGISTHILDTSQGRPAAGVAVTLEQLDGTAWRRVGQGVTDADGRIKPLLETIPAVGAYRLRFEVAAYFLLHKVESFYPSISVDFTVRATGEHYHVPLLLNPFGYSTYRGS